MPTRLKRLELHGFKSFATPTTFVFDPGITAIIGPNGSGKSNIADAVRWVLGEQSYANLRGRRTEDVIFAGSASRSRLGMAEVSLTLDNESGELPLAFSEITITRRAFRSGENQYLINGARVRLKDVTQVTASLGQAYTVIGQGLVDAVLSQRPEERRGLFEHAAGITGLRLKHAEAQRHLAETSANSTRLEDVLAEIEPRLRSLERAARQAREAGQVREQLQHALVRWYRSRWDTASARLREAEAAAEGAVVALKDAERQRAAAAEAVRAAERQVASARLQGDSHHGEVQRLREEHQQAEHRLALAAQRLESHTQRRDDLSRGLSTLRSQIETACREYDDLGQQLEALDGELVERQREAARLEETQAQERARRAALQAEMDALNERVAQVERTLLAAESRLALLDQQEHDLRATLAHLAETSESHAQRAQALDEEAAAAAECERRAREELDQLTAGRNSLDDELARAREDVERAAQAVQRLERQRVEHSTRLETLQRLRDSGAGLYAGTRATLEAARAGRLKGILGTLASLLTVPTELEAAVEAALGGHLQDIVVERWRDAEQAIDLLKRTQAGRATFQPLDTVRATNGRRPPQVSHPGVRGLAADLISYDQRIEAIVVGLLGRVIVADDLAATRAILPALPAGWTVVTLGGEITRASGSVTGGARVKESGALARERELRELPKQCRAIERELAEERERLARLNQAAEGLAAERAALDREIAATRDRMRDAQAAAERVRQRLQDLDQAASELARRRAESEARLADLDEERHGTRNQLEQARRERDALEHQRDRLGEQLALQESDDVNARLQEVRSALDTLRERRRSLEQQRARLESTRSRLQGEVDEAERHAETLAVEIRNLHDAIAGLTEERARLSSLLDAALAREGPLRDALEQARVAEQAARDRLSASETRVRELERERDRLDLEVARRRDELDLVRERAAHDLGRADIDALLEAATPVEPVDQAALQREIERLRERLRRIGAVGEDTIEQFEREAERYAFLRSQLDDVNAAGDTLRALMAELERTMVGEFEQTFGEVARAFEATFTALFGGGKARLIRSDDDGGVGIDILAQPPGKRLQSLTLLSGGERALTAVALLFAILKVNPSPFCLLDEVDAALDEANVVRVRDELRALADRTQFVVVTHNRATIEGADTLYGITMGDDAVSRVLSLRLPAEAAV